MKKWFVLLLTVLMLCTLVGCGDKADTDGKDTPTTTTTAPEQTVAPLTLMEGKIPGDCLWCPDPTAIAQEHVVMLKANRNLIDVRFLTLNPDPPTVGETVYTYPSLTEGQIVAFYTYINDAVPNRGIACTDANGKTYYYAFTWSGKDGSVSLTEIENIQEKTEDLLNEVKDYLSSL